MPKPDKKKKALDAALLVIKEHCRTYDDCDSAMGTCVLKTWCKDKDREPWRWENYSDKNVPEKLKKALNEVVTYCDDQGCDTCLIAESCEGREEIPEYWSIDEAKGGNPL